ncbi:MAG: hypothetical protein ABFS09_01000 [Thermodesulfobacteriota bacterium]
MSKKLVEKIHDHLALLDRLAARRFNDPGLAEEAVVYALEKLQDGDGKRLAGFSGRARFSSYLGSVTCRLFEDFSRSRFGRLRPPSWLTKLGGWWLVLYRFLCLERQSLPDALNRLETCGPDVHFDAEEAASRILSEITDCGKYSGKEDLTSDGDMDCEPSPGQESQVADLEKKERGILFAIIFQNLLQDQPVTPSMNDSFRGVMDISISMSAEERLLLKLCFQDELSVSQAAKLLKLTVHQAHGKMRRLLLRLKKTFTDAGLAEELLLLLNQEC